MFLKLSDENINQYFIESTYKIIPKIFKPYKLLTNKGFNIKKNVQNYVAFPILNLKTKTVLVIFLNI